MVISVTELRPGITVEVDGDPWEVLEYHHIKMGRGGAVIKTKMKNLKSGATIERSFKGGEKVERAHIERKQMQYLYSAENEYHFMDQETYEQIALSSEQLGDTAKYLKEGFILGVKFYEEKPLGVELPASVELKIKETGPGIRGDTAAGGSKPATLESGLVVQVPLFINTGDMIKVDTRSGKYIERV